MARHRVVTVAQEGAVLLDVAIPIHVFDYHSHGRYQHRLVSDGPVSLASLGRFPLATQGGLELLSRADTIIVPGYAAVRRRPSDRLLRALRRSASRGARIMSICTGAFTLAWAGLLDGRRATTHWYVAEILAQMFPRVDVDSSVLYIDSGNVLTSAGVAAGLDLCLYVVRKDHGAAAAAQVARHTLVAPHRDGGQSQFVQARAWEGTRESPLGEAMSWSREHLDRRISLAVLARESKTSVRTLSRRFREATGMTPLQWVRAQRVALACELLETTTLTVETVARNCGFPDAPTLRRHFAVQTGTTPRAYRTTYSARPEI
ncbi:MAG TPA: helix-turn-helix domain-containing protein [Verrucomicrobiae bacterium]|nr:helix-turn-helix domain-containing protein [Verrucomicrobiae bacterium]